eukprot:1159008-Pelagomonas_calceolata.AAC.5
MAAPVQALVCMFKPFPRSHSMVHATLPRSVHLLCPWIRACECTDLGELVRGNRETDQHRQSPPNYLVRHEFFLVTMHRSFARICVGRP